MTAADHGGRTIFLSAGESSGDLHGAHLARELLRRDPDLRLVGLGGSRMRAAGVELLEDLDTLAVMGFAEVIRSLPALLRVRWRVHRWMKRHGVDLLVPIDYPGFNLPLACHASGNDVPVLYYIAPQVWAWRAGRARKLARCTDRICTVLPFEEAFLSGYGADVRFVGHPLLDDDGRHPDGGAKGGGDGAPEEVGAGADGAAPGARDGPPVLGLFPGSRAQEVERILPPLREAARRLREGRAGLEVAVARAPDLPREVFEDVPGRLAPPDEVLASCRAALTKSGTITLQLALAGVPMVVGYRVNALTFLLARHLVSVDHVALVNLVAGREVVPELIQDELTPDRLVEEVEPLLEPGSARRRRMRRALAGVREELGEPGCTRRVADEAMALLEGNG